jgi:hypothetical protein
MTNRRQLNRVVEGIRRHAAPDRGAPTLPESRQDDVLAALALPFTDPQTLDVLAPCVCSHPLGGHEGIGGACGFGQCGCPQFTLKEPSMETHEIDPTDDPLGGMEEPPDPDELEDLPEPPDPDAEPEAPRVEDHRPELKAVLDASGMFGHPIEIDYKTRVLALPDAAARQLAAGEWDLQPVGAPEPAADPDPGYTPVRFPVVVQGAPGVSVLALEEPARRVAELVEAIQPVLMPPPVVAELEALIATSRAITAVTTLAEYERACQVYEQLCANEKGIEQTIGPVKAFFHRPWKVMCDFMGGFARDVDVEKKRISPLAGAWRKAEDDRAKLEAERIAREQADAERARLREEAAAVDQAALTAPTREEGLQLAAAAEQLTRAAEAVVPVAQTPRSAARSGGFGGGSGPKNKTAWVCQIVDEDKFFKALADGTIPRSYVCVEQGKLDRQAADLKGELEKRYPGLKAVEVPGIASKGGKR